MDDSAEVFTDLKKISQERRASNRERSANMLVELGVSFESKNSGAHLIVSHNGITADFWPGTGKFIPRAPGSRHGRGVFNLLELLGVSHGK